VTSHLRPADVTVPVGIGPAPGEGWQNRKAAPQISLSRPVAYLCSRLESSRRATKMRWPRYRRFASFSDAGAEPDGAPAHGPAAVGLTALSAAGEHRRQDLGQHRAFTQQTSFEILPSDHHPLLFIRRCRGCDGARRDGRGRLESFAITHEAHKPRLSTPSSAAFLRRVA
jgi:hypothetical protein